MSPALSIHGLNCAYPGTTVLRDVNLAVDRREFFIVIGPNGSGKTTLIKAIARLLPASGGEIRIGGRPLNRLGRRELARRLAYVPQNAAEDTPFSVEDLVLMGRAPYLGVLGLQGERDLAIARQAIEFTGLGQLADRPVSRLSGGERQRSHIARAICQQPELILLDEPTASLDLAHQIRVMELMADLKSRNATTVVMVSHDINLAAMFADRLLLLVDGRVAACGPPDQVIEEKILETAYGCRIRVDASPFGPWPRVNLLRGDGGPSSEDGKRRSEV
jgi:iron complex transport system ATP-binding protein